MSGFFKKINLCFSLKSKGGSRNTPVPVRPISEEPLKPASIIYKSEMDFISRCILDYPNIETGGQLFGYYTESGTPVVLYAIGPGKKANHQTTFFNQDIDYLVRVGKELKDRFGLHHIGEWHSHHRLGLAHPSGHDANTMVSTIKSKNLGRFLLCIGNLDGRGTTLNPFPCDERGYEAGVWDIIRVDSPVRAAVDNYLKEIIVMPRTGQACHSSESLNDTPKKPSYPEGYWMEQKQGNQVLKQICDYLTGRYCGHADMAIRLDERGLVHIRIKSRIHYGKIVEEDIMFPEEFPEDRPQVRRQYDGGIHFSPSAPWEYKDDILGSFINFYSKLN